MQDLPTFLSGVDLCSEFHASGYAGITTTSNIAIFWKLKKLQCTNIVTDGRVSLFLWLSNIPVYIYIYTKTSFSIHLSRQCFLNKYRGSEFSGAKLDLNQELLDLVLHVVCIYAGKRTYLALKS